MEFLLQHIMEIDSNDFWKFPRLEGRGMNREIRMIGDFIYYILSYSYDSSYCIFQIKKDGTQKALIKKILRK